MEMMLGSQELHCYTMKIAEALYRAGWKDGANFDGDFSDAAGAAETETDSWLEFCARTFQQEPSLIPKRVRITGCENEAWWYASGIGEVFEVIGPSPSSPHDWAVRRDGDTAGMWWGVSRSDCELIETADLLPKRVRITRAGQGDWYFNGGLVGTAKVFNVIADQGEYLEVRRPEAAPIDGWLVRKSDCAPVPESLTEGEPPRICVCGHEASSHSFAEGSCFGVDSMLRRCMCGYFCERPAPPAAQPPLPAKVRITLGRDGWWHSGKVGLVCSVARSSEEPYYGQPCIRVFVPDDPDDDTAELPVADCEPAEEPPSNACPNSDCEDEPTKECLNCPHRQEEHYDGRGTCLASEDGKPCPCSCWEAGAPIEELACSTCSDEGAARGDPRPECSNSPVESLMWSAEEQDEVKSGGDLSIEEIITACRNVGIDLSCGGCACEFYTGTQAPHDESCTRGPCEWRPSSDPALGECGVWETSCGEQHIFLVDGPKENKCRFCSYCGRPLVEAGKVQREREYRMKAYGPREDDTIGVIDSQEKQGR